MRSCHQSLYLLFLAKYVRYVYNQYRISSVSLWVKEDDLAPAIPFSDEKGSNRRDMLKIDGMQRKHLQNALLSAFPSWLDLKQMVDFELNENLDSIVRNSNLKHTVFELIKWAEAHGRMNDLIRAALKANPDNLELHAFAAQVHFDPNPQASFPFHDMLSHVEGQNTREIQNSSTLLSTPSMMDVGIVIALREEFTEIYKEIKNRCKPLQDAETGRYYYLFEHAGAKTNHKYKCVATFVGEMGSIKESFLTQQLLTPCDPPTLIMLRIP